MIKTSKLSLKKYLTNDWLAHLAPEFGRPYVRALEQYLLQRYKDGHIIYPVIERVFHAFKLTPLSAVKAIILGQDPYHGLGQAHGLAFSVLPGCRIPPSLRNIFCELQEDLALSGGGSGSLECWAQQGVLLLNTVLTVEAGRAGSHQKRGWENFTDRVIQVINEHAKPSVFMLWGSHAQKKVPLINQSRHAILQAPHPSPLSAYRGFLGSKPFSNCNQQLQALGRETIRWELA